ncbi:MAG TPA: acyl carrier protein [Amycolatopsis sp.]|uniref:acyl carrier protein n=1 Tax=Amycolatopsis sp. TaxID=37632 RepID=UPI002B4657FB|nr:acyl carrier protein [Amycolatopsis sp.]HKS47170.1 acyl carrier protein [Amycolatopsis sp.]
MSIDERKARIKELVCEVFELSPSEMGAKTMFAELGVESLAAIELLTVLESEFAIEIDDDTAIRMVNLDAVYRVVAETAGWPVGHGTGAAPVPL